MPITASTAASAQDGDAIPTDISTDISTRNEDSCNDATITSTAISAKSANKSTTDDSTITTVSKVVACDDDAVMEANDDDSKWVVDEFGFSLFVRDTKIQGRYVTAPVFMYFSELARTYKHTYELDSKLAKELVKESTKASISNKDTKNIKTPPKSKTKSTFKLYFIKKSDTKHATRAAFFASRKYNLFMILQGMRGLVHCAMCWENHQTQKSTFV